MRGTNTWVVVVVKSSEGLPAGSWGRTLDGPLHPVRLQRDQLETWAHHVRLACQVRSLAVCFMDLCQRYSLEDLGYTGQVRFRPATAWLAPRLKREGRSG